MAAILLGAKRSEFLAIPTLVRFLLDDDGRLSLAVKAHAVQLKYLVAAERISLSMMVLEGGGLAYAVTIPDDPDDPAYIWSMVESENEVAALNALLGGVPCSLHLFNEIAINVASTALRFEGLTELAHDLRVGAHLQTVPPMVRTPAAQVVRDFDALRSPTPDGPRGWLLNAQLEQAWTYPKTWYYSNGGQASYLSLVDTNDGAQQEALGLWLTDVLTPQGAHLNPTVIPGQGRPRELCDVLLTSEGFTFVIESKALAVLTRAKLPTRKDLHADVVSHIFKAVKQISGAIRFLRLGYPVRDHLGNEIDINRERSLHLIILIPDLSLLSASDNLGNVFLADQIRRTGCFVHLLDPAQLLRVVQAATTIAKRSSHTSRVAALNWYLGERLNHALALDTPDFDFLLRLDDDHEPEADCSEA